MNNNNKTKPSPKAISTAMKRYRIERNLTLDEIAGKVGLSPSGYQKLENGIHVPSDRTLYRLTTKLRGLTAMIEAEEKKQRESHNDESKRIADR